MSPACCFLPIGPLGNPAHAPMAAAGADWVNVAPNWITAIATVGLLAGAIFTAIYVAKAFGKQSREVAILAEQNGREADERRRDQASRIYLAAPRESQMLVKPSAVNASDLPVHEAQIWYADPGGLSGPEDLGMIMPKTSVPARRQFSAAKALTHTVLTFRDSAGLRWVRLPDGTFDQQKRPGARESVLAALGRLPDASPGS